MTAFVAPDSGSWRKLSDHFPGALTPEYQRIYAETCPPGMGSYMARYGVVARTLDVAFVHGHLYISPVPLVGPKATRLAPPAALVWLLSRLHPAFRRRTKAAAWALAQRPWRQAAEIWFAEERDVWTARCQSIEDGDPTKLGDDTLADHLNRCRALVGDGYRRHFEMHGDDLLPVGLLLARAAELGIDASSAMRALAGASPGSTGATEPPAWQLVTGYDLDSRAWCELDHRPRPHPQPASPPTTDLHPDLDVLVDDARQAVALRDDNGIYTAAWPMGLLRRAMLEAGRRIGLDEQDHAVELTVDELVGRLDGSDTPSSKVAADRAADRQQQSLLDAPQTLGPAISLPLITALPRPLALMGAAQLAAADNMLPEGSPAIGIGQRRHVGRALVVDDPAAVLDQLEEGDVLVTVATSPSWNVVLAHVGALVTASGGLLSHAAIIARELDLPAVIGDATAMQRLRTGMVVEVDPTTASVRVLDHQDAPAS